LDSFATVTVEQVYGMVGAPSLFISYSWEDLAHKEWVATLAERLRADGVNVRLDQWLLQPGARLPHFMESAIRDSDFVLVVCTPVYKAACDSRTGGVGYEGDVLTSEILTGSNHDKFIPVLRKGNWNEAGPSWALGRWYLDLRGSPYQEAAYQRLLQALFGRFSGALPARHPDPAKLSVSRTADKTVIELSARRRSITASFLDHYVLELSGYGRGNQWLDRRIATEAVQAFRVSLLLADEVLVPAVSYFQSPLCRRIVNRYKSIFDLGVIRLIGDAHRWDEFQHNRLREYPIGSYQYDVYSTITRFRGELPTLAGSDQNTTLALHEAWANMIGPRFPDLFKPARTTGGEAAFRGQPERSVIEVPEVLGNQAFVAENIYPHLFTGNSGPLLGQLSVIICLLFFRVLNFDFSSGYIDDLVYIRRIVPGNVEFVVSYSEIVRRLRFEDELYTDFLLCRPLDLLRMKADPRVMALLSGVVTLPPPTPP
jgi:hypothetical protein